jgi:hypothetical protein
MMTALESIFMPLQVIPHMSGKTTFRVNVLYDPKKVVMDLDFSIMMHQLHLKENDPFLH